MCTNETQIIQLDGNISNLSDNPDTVHNNSNDDEDDSLKDDDSETNSDIEYDTDDEIDATVEPLILAPVPNQVLSPSKPAKMEILTQKQIQSSPLPLCMMLNARSIYNKCDNLKNLLYQICPDLLIISETWERQRLTIDDILSSDQFKSISYKREKTGNRQPGGGCAIIYNERRFNVSKIDMLVPEGVEACWALFSPISITPHHRIKKLVVGSIYVSPRSQFKQETVEHIIENIHYLRSIYDNDVSFLVGGDLNRIDIEPILDSYGALRQAISVPTRKSATLENIITDLCTLYHPPTTLPPLQVDTGKKGKDGDHEVIIFAPMADNNFIKPRVKKSITIRPLPESGIREFGKEITSHDWREVLSEKNIDCKVNNFHSTLRSQLNKHFPEQTVKISTLDKKWMDPSLKVLHRQVQREFFKNRQSKKWRKLKRKFKRRKRKAVKLFYSKFVNELKDTDPGRWYKMAQRIGAVDQMNDGEVSVEQLEGLSNQQSAELIAQHFSSVSNEYSPLNRNDLPCYLPSERPPQVDEIDVHKKINKLKKTRSTFNIDIPNKLRKEFSPELSCPLADIINNCLLEQYYPKLWKYEMITPAPKVSHPKLIKDLRKISSTSDYSKVFESFLRDWILEDISGNLDIGQFGGQPGTGTEHMMVYLVDRILKLLDSTTESTAVMAAMIDWSNAFDRQDPTLAIKKFIKLGVRTSLIPLLASYLEDRKMKVKFNGKYSQEHSLIGGGPQGTLLGLIEYLVQSNDAADFVDAKDRFKYIDDLSILELIFLSGVLTEFDCYTTVPSDIGVDQLYLPPESYNTQRSLDKISAWTDKNLMMINADKTNYMVFSRSQSDFVTRLHLNNSKIEQVPTAKIVGVWLQSNLKWDRNTKELTIKAFSRISMITKLKYVGVGTDDLMDIYKLYIRSIVEYCSVVWHSSLTEELSRKLEMVQKICLRVILGDKYESYSDALDICNLKNLYERREERCLSFAKKCLKHPVHSKLFPLNMNNKNNMHKSREKYVVNFGRTNAYKDSTVPYLQRTLNNM